MCFTRGLIAFALQLTKGRTLIIEACRKLGVSEQRYFRWKKKSAANGNLTRTEDGAHTTGAAGTRNGHFDIAYTVDGQHRLICER